MKKIKGMIDHHIALWNSQPPNPLEKYSEEIRTARKWESTNQWVVVPIAFALVNWALQKRRKGLLWFFGQTCSDRRWGGPRPLLQGQFFRPPGDRAPGGIRLHCAGARGAGPQKCLAEEALCTHERTLWKAIIRFRWEEEAKEARKIESLQHEQGGFFLLL